MDESKVTARVTMVTRIVGALTSLSCIGLAVYFPIDEHKNFPENGWFNISWIFSFIALIFALKALAFGWDEESK